MNEFKPFDRVMVRDTEDDKWKPALYAFYKKGYDFPYYTIDNRCFKFCRPYNEEEYLSQFKKCETYEERRNAWLEMNNVKARSIVKIIRKAQTGENGWNAIWMSCMNDTVGMVGEVCSVDINNSILVNLFNIDASYYYPFFVLEVIKP